MGKSKQVDKCAPSCSAVQFDRQERSWTGLDGAFEKLENLNLVNTKFQVIANSLMIAHQFLLVKAKAVKEKLAAYLVEEE